MWLFGDLAHAVKPVRVEESICRRQEDSYRINKAKAFIWGISSAGRAPALQAGGHEFESRILHLPAQESRDAP